MQQKPSSIKQKLADDLKQAMKGGDKVKVSVIRLVMAAIKNAEIEIYEPELISIIVPYVLVNFNLVESFTLLNE